MAAAGFWDNQERAQEVVGQLKSLKAIVTPLGELSAGAEDLGALIEMATEDDSVIDEVSAEVDRLEKQLEKLELKSLLNGPNDACGAIMTIHARDGGTDANDWAEMLLRMYTLCVSISDFRLPSIRITRPVISLPGSQYRSGNYRQRV